ncbi:sensor histidine kinase [Halobacterium jilantaiense]|uniref:histidine kinase n=1 Tax=Halobacterium jilantaiense TaxID=355548 RepID=A0A1I0MWT6_9EURY|nr:HAMP domain-containing sensor histidine kinase [Halobacterium jilantaiense]SEV93260.1 Signal transduction histidine kinase [Halobacterium jilantaiense]
MTADERVSIPIDALPQPVVRYTEADDRLTVTATNDAFGDAFGDAAAGTPIEDLLATLSASDSPPVDRVVRGDSVETTLSTQDGTQTYHLQRSVGEQSGPFLVFSPVERERASGDSVGIGTVASALTHDLRNPLDVAKARLRAAEETGDSEHFDAAARAHDRMEQLIQDVLTLARGDAVVQPEPDVDVAEAVADAWESVDTQSAELDSTDALPRVTADPGRVRRVFENLFRNAVEHGSTRNRTAEQSDDAVEHGSTSPDSQARQDAVEHGHRDGARERQTDDGSAAITVTVGALENGVYVADDGNGIPPSERETVFEPGYTRTEQGTGLGLAIVERIVEAHDWQVSVTESEHGGARFEIRC